MSATRKSILSSLRPLIWVSKLYGCLPFTFQESDDKTVKVKKFSIGIIHGMILVLSSTLYRIIINIFYQDQLLVGPIFVSSALLGSVSSLISYISYSCYSKNIQNIFEELFEFSKLIKKNNFFNKVFWLTFGEILLAEFMCVGYYVLYYFTYPETFFLLEMIMEHYYRFVITLFHFQFANSLFLIFFVFNAINEEVTEKCKSNTMLELSFKKFDLNLKDLSNVMKLHGKACDLCEILNTCFGTILAFASICMMLQVVLSCYVIVNNEITMIMFLFWFCSYVIEEWYVLYACEKVVQEVRGFEMKKF